MNEIVEHDQQGNIILLVGMEARLIHHVQKAGPITSIDRIAVDWGVSPWWLRECAKRVAHKGLLKLVRMEALPGRPYMVDRKDPAPNPIDGLLSR